MQSETVSYVRLPIVSLQRHAQVSLRWDQFYLTGLGYGTENPYQFIS
jgi:hypothetical protein